MSWLSRRQEAKEIDCDWHGSSLPAFVCEHLMSGSIQGLYRGVKPPKGESRPNAWCHACEQGRVAADGWNQQNMPQLKIVCGTCWDEIAARNVTGREDP